MLTDPEEIRIISTARQKHVRNPNRSRRHFQNIFDDFLDGVRFQDAVLLDLGPGQYDFAEMARARGAVTHGIDLDPPVVELGRHKGFPVRWVNLRDLRAADYNQPFDGLFCKYSINAFWFREDEAAHRAYVDQIGRLIKPGGWAWVAPWNSAPRKADMTADQIARILTVQAEAFKDLGFQALDLTAWLAWCYGVHGKTANRALFMRNLPVPARLRRCGTL